MSGNGWIKLHRKITEWEWYTETKTFALFLHLILTCNFKPTRWRGINLHPGESIKSIETLADETHLSVQNIRTAIKNLILTGELTERQHGKHRILMVKKYNDYQIGNTESNRVLTGIQQGANREVTADKEGKKGKKDKKHIYGEHGKVLLSDEELRKLKEKFPDWEDKIKELDEGIAMKGYKYKSHYLAILQWAKKPKPTMSYFTP